MATSSKAPSPGASSTKASSKASGPSLRRLPWLRWVAPLLVVAVLAVLPLLMSEFVNETLARIGVFAVAVLGLNVVMGYAGQVSLGQIFFLGVGAYVTAYGVTNDWNIVLVFVLACLVPALAGLVVALAAARLGGLAIAMVTIALPIVGVPLAKRLSDYTGGSQGMSARFAEAPEGSGLYDDQWKLYLVLAIGGIVYLLTRSLVRGKFGRAFAIVKGNENVASSMGISPYRYKVLAFTIASLIGGVSGFLYMLVIQYTSPETMSFGHSIELVAAMVIGGAASIAGSILGGAFYVLVPQLTNQVDASLTTLLQGAILLVVLFVLPGGLASLPRALTRGRRRPGADRGPAASPTTPSSTSGSGTAAGQPETERQGHA